MELLFNIQQLKTDAGSALSLIVILLVCVALEALILFFLMRRRRWLRVLAAFLSFAFALTAFSLAFPDAAEPEPTPPAETEALTEGDPRDTAVEFLSALQREDYPAAYACLEQYRTLGLEDDPQGEAARMLADAMRGSYAFHLRGGAVVDGLDARQSVSLTVLDPEALVADLKPDAEAYLQMLSQEIPRSRLADAEGRFLPEIAEQAYLYALQNALEHWDDYLRSVELELQLRYTTEGWRILVDQPLLDALGGMLPGEGSVAHE